MRKLVLGILIVTWFSMAGPGLAADLSFEERVRAQAAIERVRYSHQVGASRPFEVAVPREALEREVRTYLLQSAILESFWKTPVTAEMLHREIDRIASQTRLPSRLTELYAALDGDPVLILECLARPILVDRLTHDFFADEERIHSDARAAAEKIHEHLLDGTLDPGVDRPERIVWRLEDLEPEERSSFPEAPGEIGPVSETGDFFVVTALSRSDSGEPLAVAYTIPKRGYEEWFEAEAPRTIDGRSRPSPRPTMQSRSPQGIAEPTPCLPSGRALPTRGTTERYTTFPSHAASTPPSGPEAR